MLGYHGEHHNACRHIGSQSGMHISGTPIFYDIWGTELYNHTEPVVFINDGNVNLAGRPEMKSVVVELRHNIIMLQSGWRAALPPVAG